MPLSWTIAGAGSPEHAWLHAGLTGNSNAMAIDTVLTVCSAAEIVTSSTHCILRCSPIAQHPALGSALSSAPSS